jgi:hypothetical protein
MKKQRILVGLWLLAGLLELIAGLRDIFAPGFLSMSGRAKSTGDIALEFGVAAAFFAIAALTIISRKSKSLTHN